MVDKALAMKSCQKIPTKRRVFVYQLDDEYEDIVMAHSSTPRIYHPNA